MRRVSRDENEPKKEKVKEKAIIVSCSACGVIRSYPDDNRDYVNQAFHVAEVHHARHPSHKETVVIDGLMDYQREMVKFASRPRTLQV
jgi:hypothetical protein